MSALASCPWVFLASRVLVLFFWPVFGQPLSKDVLAKVEFVLPPLAEKSECIHWSTYDKRSVCTSNPFVWRLTPTWATETGPLFPLASGWSYLLPILFMGSCYSMLTSRQSWPQLFSFDTFPYRVSRDPVRIRFHRFRVRDPV